MSAIDADEPDAIDIKAHVDKFQQLTDEENHRFFSSLDSKGRQLLVQLLAERAGEPTDSIEENEVFLGRGPSSPPHAGDPQTQKSQSRQLVVMESPLHMQGRSTVMRVVFLGLSSAIVAILFVNFYSLLQANISQFDLLKLSTAILAPTRDTTSPHVLAPAVQTQSEVEAKPAAQVPANVEPAAQAALEAPAKVEPYAQLAPQVPANVEPAAQAALETPAKVEPYAQSPPQVPVKVEPLAPAARVQAPPLTKQSRQQRAAQSTEPRWSRDANSFITYLFFGKIHAARAEARPNRHQRQNRSNKLSIKDY